MWRITHCESHTHTHIIELSVCNVCMLGHLYTINLLLLLFSHAWLWCVMNTWLWFNSEIKHIIACIIWHVEVQFNMCSLKRHSCTFSVHFHVFFQCKWNWTESIHLILVWFQWVVALWLNQMNKWNIEKNHWQLFFVWYCTNLPKGYQLYRCHS